MCIKFGAGVWATHRDKCAEQQNRVGRWHIPEDLWTPSSHSDWTSREPRRHDAQEWWGSHFQQQSQAFQPFHVLTGKMTWLRVSLRFWSQQRRWTSTPEPQGSTGCFGEHSGCGGVIQRTYNTTGEGTRRRGVSGPASGVLWVSLGIVGVLGGDT